MIRFLLRTLGFILMAMAFATLVVDGTRSIAGGHLLQYSVGDIAAWLAGPRYGAAAGGVAQFPDLLRQVAAGLLAVPGWLVAGGVGLLLLHAGRPPVASAGFSGRRA